MPACTIRTIELTIIERASLGWERWPSSEAITRSGIEALMLGLDPARAAGEGRGPEGDEMANDSAPSEGISEKEFAERVKTEKVAGRDPGKSGR